MCFSVEASFVSAGILIPASAYALKKSSCITNNYWAFALFPLLFGIQQAMEGGVWLSLDGGTGWLRLFTLCFLFFALFLWPVWVPLSGYLTEVSPARKKLFFWLALAGCAFGATLYIPVLLNPDWVSVSVINLSIDYSVTTIYHSRIPLHLVTIAYTVIVLTPLLLSSDRYHRILGILIAVSGFVAWAFFDLVFVSVWCYFAAVISAYIIYLILMRKQHSGQSAA